MAADNLLCRHGSAEQEDEVGVKLVRSDQTMGKSDYRCEGHWRVTKGRCTITLTPCGRAEKE